MIERWVQWYHMIVYICGRNHRIDSHGQPKQHAAGYSDWSSLVWYVLFNFIHIYIYVCVDLRMRHTTAGRSWPGADCDVTTQACKPSAAPAVLWSESDRSRWKQTQDIFMVKIVWFLDILKLLGPGNAAMSEMGICFQLHEVLGLDVKDTSNSRLVGCEEVAWRC